MLLGIVSTFGSIIISGKFLLVLILLFKSILNSFELLLLIKFNGLFEVVLFNKLLLSFIVL